MLHVFSLKFSSRRGCTDAQETPLRWASRNAFAQRCHFVVQNDRAPSRCSSSWRRARNRAPAWLELLGKASEPIGAVTDVVISMYLRKPVEVGTARPASVGAIIQVKPEVSGVLTWSPVEFDRVGTCAGRTTQIRPSPIHKPHYNSDLVVSASFSNELEDS